MLRPEAGRVIDFQNALVVRVGVGHHWDQGGWNDYLYRGVQGGLAVGFALQQRHQKPIVQNGDGHDGCPA
jgi:hypothetical protein